MARNDARATSDEDDGILQANGDVVIHKLLAKHLQAFEVWYALDRHFARAAVQVGCAEYSIRAWAKWWDWHAQADKRDIEAEKIAARTAIKRRAKMIEEHRKLGELMRARAFQYFHANGAQATPIERTADAINAAAKGIEIERAAEGLPSWIFSLLEADDDTLAAIVRQAASQQQADGGDGGETLLIPGPQEYRDDAERYSNQLGEWQEAGGGDDDPA